MKDDALLGKALSALDADGLRAVVREVLPWLGEDAHARLMHAIVDRAARGHSGWSPPGIHAFLARDYPGALAIFRALLVPASAGDIDWDNTRCSTKSCTSTLPTAPRSMSWRPT
jgi:hypothetical protein